MTLLGLSSCVLIPAPRYSGQIPKLFQKRKRKKESILAGELGAKIAGITERITTQAGC